MKSWKQLKKTTIILPISILICIMLMGCEGLNNATPTPTLSPTEAPTPIATKAPTPIPTEAPTPIATLIPTTSATEAPTLNNDDESEDLIESGDEETGETRSNANEESSGEQIGRFGEVIETL